MSRLVFEMPETEVRPVHLGERCNPRFYSILIPIPALTSSPVR